MKIDYEIVEAFELPYREKLSLRRTVFEGGSGPKVAVVSGIHGDELQGLYVCHRLAVFLEELARKQPEALLGRVELFPALNPLGLDTLQRLIPVFETDLNRNFPGKSDGLLPERLAYQTMEALTGASLVIDIHASNIFLREIPQVRINDLFRDRLVPIAEGMNLDLIWVHGAQTVLETTIAHSLNGRDIPCLVVEMGVGMRVTPHFTEQVVQGILWVWQQLGVFSPQLELTPPSHHPLLADDGNVHYLNALTSGIFVPVLEHWMKVHENELLGHIISPFQGEILSEVRSPVDGVLFTLREYPLVYEGSLMARIMQKNDPEGKGGIAP